MKNKIIYSILAIVLLTTYSCNQDYLIVEPSEFLTSDQIEVAAQHNPEILNGSLSGIYTLMLSSFASQGDEEVYRHDDFGQKAYDIYGDMLSGDMALSVSTYGWYRDLTEFQVTTDYTDPNNYRVWKYYYKIIRSANLIIDALGGNDVIPDNDENKWIMGQAKALRAHSYFYLTQFFANSYNSSAEILPLYTSGLDQNGPKVSTQVIFDLMISDLNDAIVLLENFNRGTKTEVNKQVAQAILAYVYGVMGNNAEIKTLTADIIATGGFTMMSSAEVLGGFNDVNTSGWMWGVDITLDQGLDLVSWWGQMDLFTYSYAWAGDRKAIDEDLFNAIPANDIRKNQFYPTTTSSYYLMPLNKFYHPARNIGGQRTITTDYVYMRIAEIYLLNAEASAKSGDEAGARLSLKVLLSQRIPDTSYVDALSGQALLNEIYLQTRIELWGEGKSYLALKRNQASTTRGGNHLSNVGNTISYDDERLTFEIPIREIENNPFITNQN